jgi:hypothetical protein
VIEMFETMDTPGGFIRASGTEAAVCRDVAARQAKGLAKYGTTVRGNPLTLREWHQHHYEELLDAAVYVKRIIEQMDKEADDGK